MKRLFTLVTLLAALLCSTTLRAESYGLRVAGVSVTDANKDNITGSGISGKITYNPSTKRLTIAAGTTITTTSDGISNREVDGLSILFEGDVTIKTSCTEPTAAGIICFKNTTFTKYTSSAAPVIRFTNTGTGGAIHTYQGAKIDTWGVWIYAQAENNDAIKDLSPGTGSIVFNYSRVYAKGGSGKQAYKDFTSSTGIVLNSSVFDNINNKFDSSKGGVVNSSGTLVQDCWIEPAIMIGKKYIGTNEYDLTKEGTGAGTSASGKVKWNQSAGTLTLTNVNVNGSYFVVRVPNLKIVLNGDCSFESTTTAHDPGIRAYENITIEGDATLKLTAHNVAGLEARNNANITLNLKELQALGKTYGVSTGGTLTLNKYNDETVYKFAGETANVYARNLVMNDVDISTANSYWNSSDGYTYYNGSVDKSSSINNGTWFKSTNQIEYYPIWVAGTQIKKDSPSYISSPGITSGTVTYSPSSKTLNLNNVTIKTTGDTYGIRSELDELIINATGTTNITSETHAMLLARTTIKGSGTMKVQSSNKSGIYAWAPSINSEDITLQRSGGEMYVIGKERGFYGSLGSTLYINKDGSNGALYKFAGEKDGDIYNVGHFELGDGVKIHSRWTWFNDHTKMMYRYGDTVKTPASDIEDNGTWIRGDVTWTEYPISVCGVTLYGAFIDGNLKGNAAGFCCEYLTKSGLSYDPGTKVLTLNGVDIKVTESISGLGAIKIEENAEATIKVNGNNTIDVGDDNYASIWCRSGSKVTIEGSGSLKVNGKFATYVWNCDALNIQGDVNFESMGSNTGIGSNSSTDTSKLTVGGNAVVKASAIHYLAGLTLKDGQTITEPAGAEFKSNGVYFGSDFAQNIVITKAVDYGFEVCDVAVNSVNADNPNGDGKFSYNASSKTLTINGASIDDTGISNVVYNKSVEGLTIKVLGTNNFKIKDNFVQMAVATTVTGDGTVNCTTDAEDGYGFYLNNDNTALTFDGPTFNLNCQEAVGGDGNNNQSLTFKSGKMVYQPKGSTGIWLCGIRQMAAVNIASGYMITEPAGGYYDTTLGALTVDGTNVYSGKMVIEKASTYALTIAGTRVTGTNASDVLGDGVFKYNDATKTLIINGNCSYGSNIIDSEIEGLTIKVAGNSVLTVTSSYAAIRLRKATAITGGKLTLVSEDPAKNAIGVYISEGNLLITDAAIDITGDGFTYGLTGEPSGVKLTIDNSNITATAHVKGAIYDWAGITLTDCYIDTPRPSQILTSGIADGDGTIVGSGTSYGTVVIKTGTDAINSIDEAKAGATDIYDASGRKLDQTRRGINIVRTADGKTQKVVKK